MYFHYSIDSHRAIAKIKAKLKNNFSVTTEYNFRTSLSQESNMMAKKQKQKQKQKQNKTTHTNTLVQVVRKVVRIIVQ